jgi:hypothetical protein
MSEADLAGGIDLAALELTADAPVQPMPVRPTLLPSELLGARVEVVGVGRSESSSPESAPRARVSTTVSRVCSRLVRLGDAAANACDGDSGGAVLYEGQLAAIVSFGLGGCNTPSSHTRLDAHRAWLDRMIAGRFDESCPECVAADSSCGAPVSPWPASPEPSADCSMRAGPAASDTPWLIAALGCAWVLRRRCRRRLVG